MVSLYAVTFWACLGALALLAQLVIIGSVTLRTCAKAPDVLAAN